MLTYSFDNIKSQHLYQHLYESIRQDILSGVLKAGEKLPSKRTFAKHLGISTITIENAYGQLMAEGYIYSLPKKGYFVSRIESAVPPLPYPRKENRISLDIQPASYFTDLVSNETNPDNFPFSIWGKLTREMLLNESHILTRRSPCGGILKLREAISGHLKQFRNMDVVPEQIIIGAGTEYLYGLIIQLLGHQHLYALEDPGYRKLSQVYRSNRVNCCFIPMTYDGIDMNALNRSGADILHISPAHHYPTGIVTPAGKRYQLLHWALGKESRYIIEDDFDSEFRMTGKPVPTLQSIDVAEKVIYMNTFSKSLTSTIRISYMILPTHLANIYYEKLGFYTCPVSTFEQYTLAEFIQQGYFERHINRMRTYYKNLRNQLLNEIKSSPLASQIKISEEHAGLHFLMKLDTTLSDEEIIKKAKEQNIRLSCLSDYYEHPPKESEHTLIMNYSGIRTENIPVLVKSLSDAFCKKASKRL